MFSLFADSRPLSASQERRLCCFALLFCVLCIGLMRALTFAEPLERDQSIYAVAAHEMLAGRPLYSDIWDIKPPAIYLTYAAAEAVAGYGRGEIYLLGVVAAIATLFGIYSVVQTLTGQRLAGVWAAFFWVLVCSDMKLQANQPNTEVFINAFLVAGLALAARAYRAPLRAQSAAWLLGAGILWAVATLFKQVAFLVPLFLTPGAMWSLPHALKSASNTRARFLVGSALLLPTVLLWALVFIYFRATGRAAILQFTLVDYGRLYAQEGARISFAQTSFCSRLVPFELFFLFPLLLIMMAGLRAASASASASASALPRFWGALLVYALAVQGAVALPGQYLLHYFQLWLPVFVIGAGLGLAQLSGQNRGAATRERGANLSAARAATLVAAVLFATQWPNWKLPLAEYSTQKYEGDFFARLPAMSRALDEMLLPNETFYQMGFDAGLYFQTRRRPPVGVLSLGSPLLSSLPPWFQQRILADLEREKPEMAVVDSAFPPTLVTRYLQAHYVVLPHKAGPEQLIFMARRGGALINRLKKHSPISTR